MQCIFIILNALATYSSNGGEKMLWVADEKMRMDVKTPGLRLNIDPI